MIYFLYGENSFEIRQAVEAIVAKFDGQAERIDGEDVSLERLPDIVMGGTLFAAKRLVIIRHLSENKAVWEVLPDWLERADDDVTLVLIESKPDKRTKTFKALQKGTQAKEFTAWKDYDTRSAEQWVSAEAKQRGLALDGQMVQRIVARSGVDQWRLYQALETLAALDDITLDRIDDSLPQHAGDSVFELFSSALLGKVSAVHQLLANLQTVEDPHKVFGLLSGQVYQLAALVYGSAPSATIAKDIGVHPFALRSLEQPARSIRTTDMKRIIAAFEESDRLMKTSGIDPWLAVERALLAVTAVRN